MQGTVYGADHSWDIDKVAASSDEVEERRRIGRGGTCIGFVGVHRGVLRVAFLLCEVDCAWKMEE